MKQHDRNSMSQQERNLHYLFAMLIRLIIVFHYEYHHVRDLVGVSMSKLHLGRGRENYLLAHACSRNTVQFREGLV